MYDLPGTDSGREWVEVFNGGSTSVDLSSFKFSEATTNHVLRSVAGNAVLQAGEYGIIADDSTKFLLDWPSFTGNLFDSSFSLSNTGATLTLKDSSGNVLDQFVYTSALGANGDGNTLQNTPAGWIVAAPTPGTLNSTTPASTSTPPTNPGQNGSSTPPSLDPYVSNGGGSSSHYSAINLSDYKPGTSYLISAGRNRLGITGIALEFQAKANIDDNNAQYVWSFGDGSMQVGKFVTHTYTYPGEYVVVVNGSLDRESSVSRTKAKINDPKITIKNANAEYIDIENKAKDEVNLYGWAVIFDGKKFMFPKDTIIEGNSKITLSSGITQMHPHDPKDVVLSITGDTSPVKNASTVESIDLKQIDELYAKVVHIESQLALIPEESEPIVSSRKYEEKNRTKEDLISSLNVAAPILSLTTSTTTTSPAVPHSWWSTLKEFFMRKRR